jgi:predicted dehydrogenase
MKPALRIGVIGVGAISQVALLPTLARLRGAQLVALCDNDGPKARALAERLDVPDVFTDIDEMLEFDELDAVVISTPSHLHEPHVLSALAAGVHVLCERPLALNVRGIERILAAATRSDKKVAVANNHRFRSDVQAVAAFLRGGELGKLSGVRTGAYQTKRAAEGWRLRRAEAGGGVFMDQGFAMLDLALWLADFPEPVRVSAHMDRARGASAVEDAMLAFVELEQGKTIVIDVNWSVTAQEDRWWFDILATRGSAQLSPFKVVKALNATPADVTPRGAAVRESAVTQSYRAELAHFLAVLREEASYEAPTDQLIVHRIAEAIYKSADEEKEIRL